MEKLGILSSETLSFVANGVNLELFADERPDGVHLGYRFTFDRTVTLEIRWESEENGVTYWFSYVYPNRTSYWLNGVECRMLTEDKIQSLILDIESYFYDIDYYDD